MALLTAKDIEELGECRGASFYHEAQVEQDKKWGGQRFYLDRGTKRDIPKDGNTFIWFERKMEALIAYNHYNKKYKTVLFVDECWSLPADGVGSYCLAINKKMK